MHKSISKKFAKEIKDMIESHDNKVDSKNFYYVDITLDDAKPGNVSDIIFHLLTDDKNQPISSINFHNRIFLIFPVSLESSHYKGGSISCIISRCVSEIGYIFEKRSEAGIVSFDCKLKLVYSIIFNYLDAKTKVELENAEDVEDTEDTIGTITKLSRGKDGNLELDFLTEDFNLRSVDRYMKFIFHELEEEF